MKTIWKSVEASNYSTVTKNRFYIVSMIFISAFLGLFTWFVIGRLLMHGIAGAICFAGYPAMFYGYYGSMLNLYNHEFK